MVSDIIWQDVKDYEGFYRINQYGVILSKFDRVMKQQKTRYCKVGLTKNKQQRNYFIHRLVALSFIPNLIYLNPVPIAIGIPGPLNLCFAGIKKEPSKTSNFFPFSTTS